MKQETKFLTGLFFLLVLSCLPAAAADTQAEPAESQGETFVAHKVENKADKAADEAPNFISVGGKVVKNTKKSGQASQTPVAEEPNFIVEGGKVIPNPRKNAARSETVSVVPPSPGLNDGEPDFISVNGRVIPNPNKKKEA